MSKPELISFSLHWARYGELINAHIDIRAQKTRGNLARYTGVLSINPRNRGLEDCQLNLHSRSDGAMVSFNGQKRRRLGEDIRDSIIRTPQWRKVLEIGPHFDRRIVLCSDGRIFVKEFGPSVPIEPLEDDDHDLPATPVRPPEILTTIDPIPEVSPDPSKRPAGLANVRDLAPEARASVVRLHEAHGMPSQVIAKVVSLPLDWILSILGLPPAAVS